MTNIIAKIQMHPEKNLPIGLRVESQQELKGKTILKEDRRFLYSFQLEKESLKLRSCFI